MNGNRIQKWLWCIAISLVFLLLFICSKAQAGVINSAHDANCCSVWVTGENPTWLFSFEKAKGGVVTTIRQPYDGSNIAGTQVENGGLGNCEFSVGVPNGWAGNKKDDTPSYTVIESTSTRFRIYIEADIIDHGGTGDGTDAGNVYDTITVYYNRLIYDRRIFVNDGITVPTSGWRPMVWTFLQSGIEDSIVFADDDEIDIVTNITHSGNIPLPSAQDTVHAQQLFMIDTDTSCASIWYRNAYVSGLTQAIDYYVSHDEATRRGSGYAGNKYETAPGNTTYQGKFVYWWNTFSHDGADLQDYFVDYMYPSPITMTYGTGGTWVETRGCYQVIDGGSDSVKFTFDRDSWTDSTVYNPVIEVASWDGFIPDTISVGGVKKIKDTDFYADTVDAKNFLIVHYLGDISGSDTEIIIPIRAGEVAEGDNRQRLRRIIQQLRGDIDEKNHFRDSFIPAHPDTDF